MCVVAWQGFTLAEAKEYCAGVVGSRVTLLIRRAGQADFKVVLVRVGCTCLPLVVLGVRGACTAACTCLRTCP